MKKKILIVDDDTFICNVLERFLINNNYVAHTSYTMRGAIEQLKGTTFDLILCDFRLPDGDGLELMEYIMKLSPESTIIIMTAYSEIKMAVKVIKKGAFDYITKPIQQSELKLLLEKVFVTKPKPTGKPESRKTSGETGNSSEEYIKGNSKPIRNVYKMVDLVAPTHLSVIIEGETGVGKEIIARTIHEKSKRAGRSFVALDCGAIPNDLANSELFGHLKGAFTGAISDKTGVFEQADNGTLFLDEIGNLDYEIQMKLLRTLQERRILKLGDVKPIDVDVRIIVATNEDLIGKINAGKFREDLYHRLNEFQIHMPALRERLEDIMTFVHFYINIANVELNRAVSNIAPEVHNILHEYPWYGNLRELKNVITRSVLMCQSDTLSVEHLPGELMAKDFSTGNNLKDVSGKAEKQLIIDTLKKYNNNKSEVARILKIDRKTLYNKLNMYNIS